MSNSMDDRNRLKYTGACFGREPVWPRDPDVAVIRSIAKKHLLPFLPPHFDDSLFHVLFFAQGGFNKIYRLSYDTHPKSYIFRVALPLDPFYKVESEAATLTFLRTHTSIPVASVVSWDSNWDTDLGFEWILTEMIDGVTLDSVWREIPWEQKLALNQKVAKLIAQLRKHNFNAIGSLYFDSALRNGARQCAVPPGTTSTNTSERENPFEPVERNVSEQKLPPPEAGEIVPENLKLATKSEFEGVARGTESAEGFAIGHMFDQIFINEARLYLPAERGPFRSSLEWKQAAVKIQLEFINKWLAVAGSGHDDYSFPHDSDLEEEAPGMKDTCHRMLKALPEIFKDEEEDRNFVLHHHDLSARNILVDPQTCKITGILDWEMTCIVPEWKAAIEPKYLQYIEFEWEADDKEPPPMPPSWDEDKHQHEIEARDRWDFKLLRAHFNATLKQVMDASGHALSSDLAATKVKQELERCIWDLTENWERTGKWLAKYQSDGADSDSDASSNED